LFKFKRLAIAVSPILTAGLVAVVAMSSTAPGQAALRNAMGKLSINAEAAGGGGGGGGGVDALTIKSPASLVAKLAVNVTVSYICRPVFDPNTGGFDVLMSANVFGSLQERTSGKTVAHGFGVAFGNAVCDEGLVSTPTVNTTTVLISPDIFPASGPFKKGTGIATVQVIACPNTFVASGVPPPCDFGSAGPTVISIK
jgi:hypothetical protein